MAAADARAALVDETTALAVRLLGHPGQRPDPESDRPALARALVACLDEGPGAPAALATPLRHLWPAAHAGWAAAFREEVRALRDRAVAGGEAAAVALAHEAAGLQAELALVGTGRALVARELGLRLPELLASGRCPAAVAPPVPPAPTDDDRVAALVAERAGLRADVARLTADLRAATEAAEGLAHARRALATAGQDITSLRERLDAAERQAAVLAVTERALRHDLAAAERAHAAERDRAAPLADRLRQVERERAGLADDIGLLAAQDRADGAARVAAEAERDHLRARLDAAEGALTAARADAAEARGALGDAEARAAGATGDLAACRADLAAVGAERTALKAELGAAGGREAALRAALAAADARAADALAAQSTAHDAALAAQAAETEARGAALAAARESLTAAGVRLGAAEAEAARQRGLAAEATRAGLDCAKARDAALRSVADMMAVHHTELAALRARLGAAPEPVVTDLAHARSDLARAIAALTAERERAERAEATAAGLRAGLSDAVARATRPGSLPA